MALIEGFKDFSTGDLSQDRLQLNLKKYFNQFNDLIFLNGILLQGVTVSSSGSQIEHKLGRVPQGWIIMDKTGQGDVWRDSWDDKFINLDASTSTTINLWVF